MPNKLQQALSKLDRGDGVPVLFFSILVVTVLLPGHSSLWLDETVSSWIIEKPAEIGFRTIFFQGQSPLYYYIIWAWTSVFGRGEYGLRSFSVLMFILSCVAVFQLARALFDRRIAVLAALLFSASNLVWVAAISARPYAFALCVSLLSLLLFLKWLEKGGAGRGALYILSVVIVFYAHYLFSLSVLLHLLIALTAPAGRLRVKAIAASWLVSGVLCAPGLFQLHLLARRAPELAFLDPPSLGGLAKQLFPLPLLALLVFAVLLALVAGQISVRLKSPGRIPTLLAVTWWLAGPVILFVVCRAVNVPMFVPRYMLWAVPGFAICVAILLSSIEGPGRIAILPALALVTVLYAAENRWQVEDWRGAARRISKDRGSVILLYSGLIESETLPRLNPHDSITALTTTYLASPFRYYEPGVPYQILSSDLKSDKGREYFQRVVDEAAGSPLRLVSLAQTSRARGESFPRDFVTRLEEMGYKVDRTEPFGQVAVVSLSR